MNEMAAIQPVRKTVRVKAPIAHAFEVFTVGPIRHKLHMFLAPVVRNVVVYRRR